MINVVKLSTSFGKHVPTVYHLEQNYSRGKSSWIQSAIAVEITMRIVCMLYGIVKL